MSVTDQPDSQLEQAVAASSAPLHAHPAPRQLSPSQHHGSSSGQLDVVSAFSHSPPSPVARRHASSPSPEQELSRRSDMEPRDERSEEEQEELKADEDDDAAVALQPPVVNMDAAAQQQQQQPAQEEEEKRPSASSASAAVVHHPFIIHHISSPLHPPPAAAASSSYSLTPLRSRPVHDQEVPSQHDRSQLQPPASFQDETDNTFPLPHHAQPHSQPQPQEPHPMHSKRVRRQHSVFAPKQPLSPLLPVSAPSAPVPVAAAAVSEQREYEVWPGKARFWCSGYGMSGPGYPAAIVSFFLILVPSVLFLVFPAVDLIDRLSVAVIVIGAVLAAVSLLFLIVTSLQDPGVIPRNPKPYSEDDEEPQLTQEIMMSGRPVMVKYCVTCRIYRPPRAVHCSLCNCCVENFDHLVLAACNLLLLSDCPWLGTCVGANNYRSFSIFLYTLTLLLFWVLAFSVTDMVYITREKRDAHSSLDSAFNAMLRRNPIAFILACYCWISAFFVVGLAAFHLYLVSNGITTNEQLKQAFPNGSPWSRGCRGNWAAMCRAARIVEPWHRRRRVRNSPPPSQPPQSQLQMAELPARFSPPPAAAAAPAYSYHIASRKQAAAVPDDEQKVQLRQETAVVISSPHYDTQQQQRLELRLDASSPDEVKQRD